jgi:hypothetical protein
MCDSVAKKKCGFSKENLFLFFLALIAHFLESFAWEDLHVFAIFEIRYF